MSKEKYLRKPFAMLLLGTILLAACSGDQAKLERMYGQEVVFPTGLVEVNCGEIISDSSVPSSLMRMVLYFGDQGCTPCQAGILTEYYDLLDSCRVRSILPVILFSGNNRIVEAEQKTVQVNYPFSVYFDEEDRFRKMNPFIPKDDRFHIFMIDKDSRICHVGNPVIDSSAMESFSLLW